jgi:hypothetical protein
MTHSEAGAKGLREYGVRLRLQMRLITVPWRLRVGCSPDLTFVTVNHVEKVRSLLQALYLPWQREVASKEHQLQRSLHQCIKLQLATAASVPTRLIK